MFKEEYNNTAKQNVLLRKNKISKPPWLRSGVNTELDSVGVKKSIKRKHKLYQRYRKTKRYHDYVEYKK